MNRSVEPPAWQRAFHFRDPHRGIGDVKLLNKKNMGKTEYLCWKKKVSSLLLPLFSMCTRYHVGFGLDDDLAMVMRGFFTLAMSVLLLFAVFLLFRGDWFAEPGKHSAKERQRQKAEGGH
jgi:hypothetical protein